MPNFPLTPALQGQTLNLRPLRAADFEALYAVAADPLIWDLHPDPRRCERDYFKQGFFASALQEGALIVEVAGEVVGSTRFYDRNPATREISIGYSFLARRLWKQGHNAEVKRLMIEHARPHALRIWFEVGVDNLRSRRAVEKLGAVWQHDAVLHGLLHARYALALG